MTSTADRLGQLFPFDPSILERVGEVADTYSEFTLGEFLAANEIPSIDHYESQNGKPIEVLDIIPKDGYSGVLVYHEAMATALDENAVMHVAAIALAAPDTRVIAAGNPGRPGQGYGKVRLRDQHKVWNGNLRPVVDPLLQYLNAEGIEEVQHTGFSYGADRVTAAVEYAENYDQQVTQAVFMDPASVVNRGIIKLALAYNSTEKHLDRYIQATGNKPYLEARKLSGGLVGYALGLTRLTNVAIAHVLAQGGFEGRLDSAIEAQPEMRSHVMWGSESELAIDGLMSELTGRLRVKHGSDRVQATRFPGQQHAMCDDIFLNAAMVLQAVEN